MKKLSFLLFYVIVLFIFSCGSEEGDIPEYKPPPDRLKFSIPPYESSVGTVFTYEDRYAKKVSIVGDFNNWNPLITPMKKNTYGIWECVVPLKRGIYHYKYNVDGQWVPDPKNLNKVFDSSGDIISVLVITNEIDFYFRAKASGYTNAFSPRHTPRGIEFTYKDIKAYSVYIGGDFNQWSKTKHPLIMNKNGIWSTTIPLERGRHIYKFCVDGQWKRDPLNPLTEPDGTGDYFSVIVVTNLFLEPRHSPSSVETVPVSFKFRSQKIFSRIPVSVIGEWNDWQENVDILTDPDQDKIWEGIVYLKPGKWLYRFKIKDEEFPDPFNPHQIISSDGKRSSLLEIFIPQGRKMISFIYKPISGEKKEQVYLTGDFNNWDMENEPFYWDEKNKLWVTVIDLPQGRYRYLFRIGNRTETDPSNPNEVRDKNGVAYSVIIVK